MPPSKAQTKPEASDTVHGSTVGRSGKEVPAQAVSLHRGTSRILSTPQTDRNASQNLVPKQTCQNKAIARIGSRTIKNRILTFPGQECCPGGTGHDSTIFNGWRRATPTPRVPPLSKWATGENEELRKPISP